MIKLIDNYEIHGNTYDYSLVINDGKTSKQTDKKTGETIDKPVYKNIGYYRDVKSCIKACYNHACRKIVAEEKLTLEEAVRKFENIEKSLEKIIPKCFEWK